MTAATRRFDCPREGRRLKLTTIGRAIDLHVPSNRAIVLLAAGSFLVGAIVSLDRGATWGSALVQGWFWGGSAFLAWSLCRETDPDRWYSAYFAAAGALGGSITLAPPSFLFLLWFILAMRTINRSTGESPGMIDLVALYGIALWLGFSTHWMIPVLTFPTTYFADLQRLPRPARIGLPLAVACATVILGFARGWHIATPDWGWPEIGGIGVLAMAVVPVIVGYRCVLSIGDRDGQPLKPRRVQWALGWIVSATMILTLTGAATMQTLAPVWSALEGTVIGWITSHVRSKHSHI